MADVAIALGSNLGESFTNIKNARELLQIIALDESLVTGAAITLTSAPIYKSSPMDCPEGSPDFLNTVVCFETRASPLELMWFTQCIEKKLGRKSKKIHNESRAIDLDILYLGNNPFTSPELTLPHPRIVQRRFVLEPLAALRPNLILPGQKLSITELLAKEEIQQQTLELAHPTW
ncbi:2-amino-4-hydroxy-6-hydroxymethyldihydropteridine diphosphokinase [Akkermansiaceae bacterium]|nr:2-amino-4-hydroxy-6-hydroxymethyldihydropteridine diphosphokinase [Akkermansiaceae bacterium]